MTRADKRFLKCFIAFLVALVVFGLGVEWGKAYVIKYQEIHSTDNGYCVEIEHKEYKYGY